jgi:hypothetical protein
MGAVSTFMKFGQNHTETDRIYIYRRVEPKLCGLAYLIKNKKTFIQPP